MTHNRITYDISEWPADAVFRWALETVVRYTGSGRSTTASDVLAAVAELEDFVGTGPGQAPRRHVVDVFGYWEGVWPLARGIVEGRPEHMVGFTWRPAM